MRKYIVDTLAGPDTVVFDQWAYEWEVRIQPYDPLVGNMVRSEYLRFNYGADYPGSIIILSHSFFYEFMKRMTGFSFATFLREPVDRIISQFYFEKYQFKKNEGVSILSWIDKLSDYVCNLQTAAFCGCPRLEIDQINLEMAKANLHFFDFVGILDRFQDSVDLFNRIYKARADDNRVYAENVNPIREKHIPEEATKILRERCKYDLQLYDYAVRLFEAKVAALEVLATGNPSSPPPSFFPDRTSVSNG